MIRFLALTAIIARGTDPPNAMRFEAMGATNNRADHSLGEGVYYASQDCRGLGVRLLILAIDLTVIIIAWFAIAYVGYSAGIQSDDNLTLIWFGFLWFYMAAAKPSPLRTVGYWLTKSQIVTLRGVRPSTLRMTFRLLLWLFGPINFVYDLAWSGVDNDKQSLRDRYSGTVLIRRGAKPIGEGEIHLARYFIAGLAILYPTVVSRRPFAANPSTAPQAG